MHPIPPDTQKSEPLTLFAWLLWLTSSIRYALSTAMFDVSHRQEIMPFAYSYPLKVNQVIDNLMIYPYANFIHPKRMKSGLCFSELKYSRKLSK